MSMFAVWDIETRGFTGDLVIGGLYDGREYYTFTEWSNFVELLHSHIPDKTQIYAHNGGKFDHRHLLAYIDKRDDIKISHFLNINGSIVFTMTVRGKRFYLRDSFLHLSRSLKKLCQSFDVKHSKKDFDVEKWIKNNYPITDELKTYLYYDCVSLYELLEKYFSIVGEPKLTIASTAFDICCKSTYQGVELEKLTRNFLTTDEEDFIRDSYRGGRTEVFKRYTNDSLFHYDVNSLYPYVMRNRDYPYGKHRKIIGNDKCKQAIDSGYLGVIKCHINAPDIQYPYLCVHHDDKLLFPCGNWCGNITSIEYQKALKLGYKIDIIEGIFYAKKGMLFKNFVDKFYEIKCNSTGAKRETAKLILNSAYGKYGQRREFDEYITFEEIIDKGLDISDFEKVNEKFYRSKTIKYTNRKINPVIATFVTAYARDYLYSGIETVIQNGGIVYYVDTDSIFTDVALPGHMVDDKKLGYWALEDIADRCIFVAPKQYQYYDAEKQRYITKVKGISNPDIDMRLFEDLQHKEIFNSSRLTGFNEHFKRVNTDKSKYIGEIKIQKIITARYSKREFCSDNNNTKPIRISISV